MCAPRAATNTTRARRQQVLEHCQAAGNFEVVFIESICTDPVILDKNCAWVVVGHCWAQGLEGTGPS